VEKYMHTIELKPMIYKNERTREILAHDVIDDTEFYIISLGTHPCAYVHVPSTNPITKAFFSLIDLSGYIYCHGGVTWFDYYLPDNKRYTDGKWLGWDYAHAGDYYGYKCYEWNDTDSKKWTTEEILEEVKDVIAQVKKYEG
jgi:hypothetical protein